MQIINQIGTLQHWGLSPACNILKEWNDNNKQQQEGESPKGTPLRILISGCSDIRHIMKTLCDISSQKRQFPKIQFYFHESGKIQLLCRMLLLIHILHEQNLNFEERTQLFLDLYGNAMIKQFCVYVLTYRQRNSRYLHLLREDLLNFIHSESNVKTPIKNIINLKFLKFEERDQMSEFIQSWSIKVDFDMEKLREQRLRALFKERYDYRANLIDWDYNMLLLPCVPIMHFYHYREWRMQGLAFEQRFSTYCQPNRTLASYTPGKRKDTKTSCLVRGFWGDIIMSPYIAIGSRCDYPQRQLLFKKANYKNIGHTVELATYNMMYWLHRLDADEQYVKVFRDYYRADQKTQKQIDSKKNKKSKKKANQKNALKAIQEDKQKAQQQQKQEDEEEMIESKTTEKQKEKPKSQKLELKANNAEELDSDEELQKQEVDRINSKQIQLAKEQLPVLKGFSKYNVQVYPMAMGPENLVKPKFHNFFDVVVLGFPHTAYLTKQRNVLPILKNNGQLLVQRATFLVPKKKQERQQIDQKLMGLALEYKELSKVAQTEQYFTFLKKID